MESVDRVPNYKNVVFVAEYFTMMSTVEVIEDDKLEGETDDDAAIRRATLWLKNYYGMDMDELAIQVGVSDY